MADRSRHPMTRGHWIALATIAACLLVATPVALGSGNQEFLIYIVVMAAMAALIYLLHRRIGMRVALVWCLAAWGLLHMAGGLVPIPDGWPAGGPVRVLYSLWLIPDRIKYDQLVHAYGFGVTAWACWVALRSILGDVRPTFGMMVLCAAAAMGFGALNEVVEFAATLVLPQTNVGGYENTGWDLVANALGAVIATTAIYAGGRRQRGEATAPVRADS